MRKSEIRPKTQYMFITPWGVELSENIQNLQIGQVEDKEKVEKRMRDTNPYISLGTGCFF